MTQCSISKSKVHKLTVYSRQPNYKEFSMDQNDVQETKNPVQEPVEIEPTREMPKYKCHKEVYALKIKFIVFDSDLAKEENRETDGSAVITPAEEGYLPFKVDSMYVGKFSPYKGGYYIIYNDGYRSFSPSDAFEAGYTLIS